MKYLTIQVQPDLDTAHSVDELIHLARSLDTKPEIEDLECYHRQVSIKFVTEDLKSLWKQLQKEVMQDNVLGNWVKRVSVIACANENQWSDALLLSHYNPTERLDAL